ncbi:DNA mismatch repair protein Mlh1 [Lepeophtheirus salmonis]|nr:DNA mismatch repair protein Mlh1-like [Lepeophtheirus salmonis]
MNSPGKILRLDEVVVNRIAAGEVIQRPANALKEMLENSLDAKANNISVIVEKGGLELLQISDDGTGIRKEDLEIVAERFTTSKLSKFEDLSSIATYGFRGEALASISHVALLTIITKTADSNVGYKATYEDSKLVSQPKPTAANQGTQIIVENLFHNLASRKRALKNYSEEYNRISDVVSKYAIHNSRVSFTLKKKGDSSVTVRTVPNSSPEANIGQIYGSNIAKELIELQIDDSEFQFKAQGFVSNANYNLKKFTMLLFINHRLVDSSAIRKALIAVYGAYLPKGTHPFVYLSLEIESQNVDVNVHPTKSEVQFLNQDEIVDRIQRAVDAKLLGSNSSRTFYAQSLLPGAPVPSTSKLDKTDSPQLQKTFIRTDSTAQKLDKYLSRSISEPSVKGCTTKTNDDATDFVSKVVEVERREIKLNSLKSLRDEINSKSHKGLRDLISNHTFVGCVNREQALLQHNTKLFLVNTTRLTVELFYQLILKDFGNFGAIKLNPPPSIKELSLIALEDEDVGWSSEDGDKNELAEYVSKFLIEKAEMLDDYFSIEIDQDGRLHTLPIILEQYVPFFGKIPVYLMKLATEVNWDEEEDCFRSFSLETAKLYAVTPENHSQYDSEQSNDENYDEDRWKKVIEHIVYPAAKQNLKPSKTCAEDTTFVQIADLPNLYKVFERC